MRNLFWCLLIIGFGLNSDVSAQAELDTTFNSTGKAVFNSISRSGAWNTIVQPDNKIVMVSGCFTQANGYFPFCVMRVNENGSLDTTFGNFGPPDNYGPPGSVFTNFYGSLNEDGQAVGLALQNDGKIIVAGYPTSGTFGTNDIAIVRYNPDGTLDSSFGSGGKVVAALTPNESEFVQAVAVQPDGKIVITGVSIFYNNVPPLPSIKYTQIIARYLANGTLDSSFGTGGIVRTIRPDASTSGQSLAIQPDGKILIGGFYWNPFSFADRFYAHSMSRFNTDGSLDTTWNGTGFSDIYFTDSGSAGWDSGIRSLAIQQDGRIVALGGYQNILLRFNTNGSLDTTFGSGGSRQALNSGDKPYDLVISSGGRITVVGIASPPQLYAVARYRQDGSRDLSFGGDGYLGIDVSATAIDGARAVAVDSLGRIVIAGLTGDGLPPTNPNYPFGNSTFSAARLLAPVIPVNPGMVFDFDGDSRADIAVYRDGTTPDAPSYWHILRSSDGVYQGIQLGAHGDKPVPSDYNGDGITEVAVWRPASGIWYTSTNPAINYGAFQWGQNGDVPLPGDFDGDGKADFVVYRPANGNWYVLKSSNGGFQQQQFGTSTDKPLLGDFDGDGKSDFAFYSPGTTELAASFWNVIQSSNGATSSVQFGRGEDLPVPGDYDGDGLTNFAVFRPSTSIWYTSLNPAMNYGAFQWGANGDVPGPADYDRDGKTDFAVFRPGNTAWYILNSGNGSVIGQQWGIASDRPVPSSFIP